MERELSKVCSVYQQTKGLHNMHTKENRKARSIARQVQGGWAEG